MGKYETQFSMIFQMQTSENFHGARYFLEVFRGNCDHKPKNALAFGIGRYTWHPRQNIFVTNTRNKIETVSI